MKMNDYVIRNDEKIIFSLRSLYEKHGYSRYKMTKFEEYDLYVRNKDFLIGENVITFNDTDGKLMALKPDVTLSIIKNRSDNPRFLDKLYYNENVYRVSKGSNSFREIMQAGLECIGDIDGYCIAEILTLAAESLKIISNESVLCVSCLEIIAQISQSLPSEVRKKILSLISEKNIHELSRLCSCEGIDKNISDSLIALSSIHGNPRKVLPELKKLLPENEAVNDFEKILLSLRKDVLDMIEIDFSIAGDAKYYNGFVFEGFINGISDSVLSGGQYDKLMRQMHRKSKAVGFAVYLDMLESLDSSFREYDVDTVVVYDDNSDISQLNKMIQKIIKNGESVFAVKNIPEKLKYKTLIKFDDKERESCG